MTCAKDGPNSDPALPAALTGCGVDAAKFADGGMTLYCAEESGYV